MSDSWTEERWEVMSLAPLKGFRGAAPGGGRVHAAVAGDARHAHERYRPMCHFCPITLTLTLTVALTLTLTVTLTLTLTDIIRQPLP